MIFFYHIRCFPVFFLTCLCCCYRAGIECSVFVSFFLALTPTSNSERKCVCDCVHAPADGGESSAAAQIR